MKIFAMESKSSPSAAVIPAARAVNAKGKEVSLSGLTFVRATDMVRRVERVRSENLKTKIKNIKNLNSNKQKNLSYTAKLEFRIRCVLSLIKSRISNLFFLEEAGACSKMARKGCHGVFVIFDKNGVPHSRRLNLLKLANRTHNIGQFRSLIRQAIWKVARFINGKFATKTESKPRRKDTRKFRALGEILRRKAALARLNKEIDDSAANPAYRLFFPELLDVGELSCLSVLKTTLVQGPEDVAALKPYLKVLGAYIRLGTVAEYAGDRDLVFSMDIGQLWYTRDKENGGFIATVRPQLAEVHYWPKILSYSRPRNNWLTRRCKALGIPVSNKPGSGTFGYRRRDFYCDPRTHPDVTCLFHDRWPIAVTAGDWRLDKEEYDFLASSRSTGRVQKHVMERSPPSPWL